MPGLRGGGGPRGGGGFGGPRGGFGGPRGGFGGPRGGFHGPHHHMPPPPPRRFRHHWRMGYGPGCGCMGCLVPGIVAAVLLIGGIAALLAILL